MSPGLKQCIQCGEPLEGPFCSQCGARQSNPTIRFGTFFNVILEYVTNWEQKLVLTIKNLFINPGKVIDAFIHEDQQRYYHPVKFLLFWGGLNYLASQGLGVGHFGPEVEPNPAMQRASNFIGTYWSFIWMATMPFTALGHYLVNFKLERKFVHHNVFALYLVGMNLMVNIPLFLFDKYLPHMESIYSGIHFAVSFFMVFHFTRNWLATNIFRSILSAVFAYFGTYIGLFIYYMLLYILFSCI